MKCYKPAVKSNLCNFIFTAAVFFLLNSSLQAAPSSCKALSNETQCGKNSDCSWVKGYTTKSGTKVNAYCRKKPTSGNTSKAASSKTTVAKKSEKESKQNAK